MFFLVIAGANALVFETRMAARMLALQPGEASPAAHCLRLRSWHFEMGSRNGEKSPQPRFLETVLTDLLSLGVPNSRIKRESYG